MYRFKSIHISLFSVFTFSLLFTSSTTFAHGTSKYVSTPITAPWGFWFTRILFAITFIYLVSKTMERLKSWGGLSSRTCVIYSIIAYILLCLAFQVAGCKSTSLTTGPPPGTCLLPFNALPGLSENESTTTMFVNWNQLCLLLMLCLVFVTCRTKTHGRCINNLNMHSFRFYAIHCLLPKQ